MTRTRKGEEAKAWLREHPRVSFVFTPFHGSWLNQVEIWFSILSNKCLKHRVFYSVRKLATGIMRFVRWWNGKGPSRVMRLPAAGSAMELLGQTTNNPPAEPGGLET
jgi:transposase